MVKLFGAHFICGYLRAQEVLDWTFADDTTQVDPNNSHLVGTELARFRGQQVKLTDRSFQGTLIAQALVEPHWLWNPSMNARSPD